MQMKRSLSERAYRVLCGVLTLTLLAASGCQTSSDDVDLTEHGVLSLVISRVSGSSVATAAANVTDNYLLSFPYTNIVLSDDQVVYIDDIPLTASVATVLGLDSTFDATVEAVDYPDEYEISFDNDGTETSCEITAPEDFDDVEPDASTEVYRDGFDLTWEEPDDEDDATISITIYGYTVSYDDDGNASAVAHSVSLSGLADDGELAIGSAELNQFLAGDITLVMTRTKSVSQKLGFASGTITFNIGYTLKLELVDDEDE